MIMFARTCLTADPGVASSILARSHTFVEIDHEIVLMTILLPSVDSRVIGESMCTKNCLVKLAQEKVVR